MVAKKAGTGSTAIKKKKGDRGGRVPGTAGVNAGSNLLPVTAITGGQSASDPVGKRVKRTKAIGYTER